MKGEKTVKYEFKTFDQAMETHKLLFSVLKSDGVVTYADLYFLANGYSCDGCSRDYYKYGWTTLMESKVRPCDDGRKWAIVLPEPIKFTSEDDDNLSKAIDKITDAMEGLITHKRDAGMLDLKGALLYLLNMKKEKENE